MKSVSNKIVRIAPGTSGVSSFNGRVGAVSPASNDYTINQIQNASELANSANTDIINPTNGQALYYNGSKWYNESPPSFPVNSVFGRVGDITAQANDYTINQIQNSSELANSANINVSAKATKDYIAYNGTQWVSKNPTFYTDIVQTSGGTFTAQLNYIYRTLSDHIDIPLCSGSDLGKRILFTGSHILNFSVDLFLRNTLGPFSISTGNGGIELIVVGTNTYDYVSMTGQYVNTATNKKFIVASTTDLSDTAINSPSTGQALIFNGTNWANSAITYPVNSVFGRTGTVSAQSGDYNISQITNASTLADSSNVLINLPAINQYLKYNGSKFVNDNSIFYLSFDSQSNTTFTPALQSINYAPGSTVIMPSCGLSDVNKRLLFITANGQNTSINFPTGIQLYEFDGGHQNFTMFSSFGTIEFIVSGSNIYSIVACSGGFLNPANSKPITPKTVNALYDTNISGSIANGDILQYNGIDWEDAPGLWDDLRISATSTTRQGSNDPTFSRLLDNGAGSQGVFCYFFNQNVEEELYFEAQLPHAYKEGTEIRPHVHFVPTTNSAGVVRWGLEYTYVNAFGVFGNTSIIYGEYTIPANSIHAHLIQGFTLDSLGNAITGIDGTGKKVSAMLLCRVFRNSAHVNDTYPNDVALIETDFHYMKQGNGSRQEYIK